MLAFWDPDLLGARPQQLEVTLRAAKQLDLSLLGEDYIGDGGMRWFSVGFAFIYIATFGDDFSS